MMAATNSDLALPAWAVVKDRTRAHIERVAALILSWADRMAIPAEERREWLDAALWHDALKDAPAAELIALVGRSPYEERMLHGPAAAVRLERDGEARQGVLDAIRFHTVGSSTWSRTGRALYMADFLEPGRGFSKRDRAFLAAHVPGNFDGVFRQVVRARLEWALREGHSLFPETVAMWNAVR